MGERADRTTASSCILVARAGTLEARKIVSADKKFKSSLQSLRCKGARAMRPV